MIVVSEQSDQHLQRDGDPEKNQQKIEKRKMKDPELYQGVCISLFFTFYYYLVFCLVYIFILYFTFYACMCCLLA